MAGVALGDIDLHFARQAWRLATWTFTFFGRRGTDGTGLALVARLGLAGATAVCVAGVVLGDIDLHFAWQAWHLVTSTFTLRGRRGILRRMRGTWWDLHFASPALVARLVPVCHRGHRGCLRGRCGTWRRRPSHCVAAVVLGDIDLHFAWQVWHLWPIWLDKSGSF